MRRARLTPFGTQPGEKQKLLFHYALREEHLRRFVRKARSLNAANWMESLIGLLELRLDNIVFRLGFARSMAAARELVADGHIRVNGRCETIGSMVLRPGDVIWLSETGAQMASNLAPFSNRRLPLPTYLQLQNKLTPYRGVVLSVPGAGHAPFEFNARQAAEHYAKRGV